MIKVVIALLFLAMIVSLTTGFVFLIKDQGQGNKRRTLLALGIRISLAIALVITVAYGIYSGQLQVGAPWSNSY